MAATKLTESQILARGEIEGVTAYQIHTLINLRLEAAGLDKIRPQMIYNYSKNGMIVNGVKGDMSVRYTTAQALEFAEKFAAKRIAKNEIDRDEISEIDGQLALEI